MRRVFLLLLLLMSSALGQEAPYAETPDKAPADGPIVPQVVGLDRAAAEMRLRQARVPRWSVVESPAQGAPGRVLFLRPGPGATCRPDTSVVLWVSVPLKATPAPVPAPSQAARPQRPRTANAGLPGWVALLAVQPLLLLLWWSVAPRLASEEEETSRTQPRLWVARA